MKFLIDAQLPPLMAEVLRDKGYEASHVFEAGGLNLTDDEIWRTAMTEAWIIVTKDEDFAERAAASREAPCIVWLRWGNLRTRPLLDKVRALWPAIAEKLAAGESLVESR